jgi:magnesium transporter
MRSKGQGGAPHHHRSGTPHRLDITKVSTAYELKRRAPWMVLGLAAGTLMVLVGSMFEDELSRRLELAFFVPVIVYISDSIGTETMTLCVRELALRRVSLGQLFWREVAVGLCLGIIAGVPMGLLGYAWFGDARLAATIGIAMSTNGVIAALTGILTPLAFARLRRDPALGTDEITTALSDTFSLLTYLAVASLILS